VFNKSLKYSFADKKNIAAKRRGFFFIVLSFIVVYLLITNFFFSMMVLKNDSMQPTLNYGDRLIFLSLGIKKILPNLPGFDVLPAERGGIVLIRKSSYRNLSVAALDKLFRFFSANRAGFPGMGNEIFIKRIIALPGDTISMSNYVLRVQPADEKYTFTEFELSDKLYKINIPNVPALWDEAIPFSGNMEKITLGSDEFFALSDDRSNTNDSRTWGPIPADFINGTAILRYWPFNKIGLP
jgi:signal peptidase I